MVTAVDLVRGLGVLTDMDVVDVAGATGWYDTDYEGKRDAALDALADGADLIVIHVEATDEAGHAGDVEEKVTGPGELGPSHPPRSGRGPRRHRTVAPPPAARPRRPRYASRPTPPTRSRTCSSIRSADGPGGTYTEPATAGCPAVPGHQLMERLIG